MGYPPVYGPVYPPGAPPSSLTFLNPVTPSDTAGYGPLSYQAFNTTGNALLLFVGVGSDNVSGYLPRTYVADNAHNWWILAGSETVIVAGANRRIDVWVAPNATRADATQGTYISVGSSMLYAGLVVSGYEISGFPTYAQVDFTAVTSGVGTSAALSGTATVADYAVTGLLLSGTGTSLPPTVTTPSGWTALTTATTGNTASDMANQWIFPAWNTLAAGAVSATWSWSGTYDYAAIAVGFKKTPTAPSQPNSNWPSVKVEAAFGFSPGNLTGVNPAWLDITTRAQDNEGETVLTAKSGRDYELSQPAAGELDMTLANQDGAFNPANTSSPYYPNVLPEVPVRVSATWNGKTYGIFYAYTNKWPQDFPNPQWGMSKYEGSDAIGVASQGQLPSALGGQVLADYAYCYYPLSEYYSNASGQLFANQSRTNLKPAIGYSQGGVTNLLTGQALNLTGDPGTGIGTSGLTGPSQTDAGYGAFVRDVALPDLGSSNVTLEFWCQLPTISGHSYIQQIAALTGPPWNFLSSIGSEIGTGNVLTVIYSSSGSTGTNDQIQAWLVNENTLLADTVFSIAPGRLIHVVFTVTYSAGSYTITSYVNGVNLGTATGAGPTPIAVSGLLMGSLVPLSGLAFSGNFTIGQAAYYPWALPGQRIAAHYNSGSTADSGDLVVPRLGKLGQWSGLGLPILGTTSSPSPLIGNADQIQGSALADAAYQLTVDEGGMFFAQADSVGSLWYSSRTSLYNLTPRYVFGDNPNEIPYDPGSGFDYSDAYLFNIVSSQRTIAASQQLFLSDGQAESAQFNAYGATAVVADQASEAEYMPRGPMSLPIETTSDEDAYDRANWSLAKYKQPHLRANQIQLHPADNPTIWGTALAVQQGDVVTVNRRPLGAAVISLNCIVQQVEHEIGPGKWDVTLTLAPYFPENAVIQLDNTSFNELQDGALGW